MALPPKLTNEQHAANLAKAMAARTRRKEVRAAVKAGEMTVGGAIAASDEDAAIARMRVSALLESVPGCGKARARRAMAAAGVAEGRRVGGLGCRQRVLLAERFVLTGRGTRFVCENPLCGMDLMFYAGDGKGRAANVALFNRRDGEDER